jgi:DNA-binding response OmpR family regulator
MKVLIVDQSAMDLTLLDRALADAGFQVEAMQDGQQALERIRADAAHLVIAGWDLDSLSGPDLCRQVRADHLSSYVYVILLTSHTNIKDRLEGLAAGADDFVSKPFYPAELVARARTAERILSMQTRDVTILCHGKVG